MSIAANHFLGSGPTTQSDQIAGIVPPVTVGGGEGAPNQDIGPGKQLANGEGAAVVSSPPPKARYSQFLTSHFPRRVQPETEVTHRKYEIEVQFQDTVGQKRKKRIKFGDIGMADIRDQKHGAKHQQIFAKKAPLQRKKLAKFSIRSKTFDKELCQQEGWPLQRAFWDCNYCWAASGEADEPIPLEQIVMFLQTLPPYKYEGENSQASPALSPCCNKD